MTNEMNGSLGHLGQENLLGMVRWMKLHCPPDTGLEIRALLVWGRARNLSVTEALNNIESSIMIERERNILSLWNLSCEWQEIKIFQ